VSGLQKRCQIFHRWTLWKKLGRSGNDVARKSWRSSK
jgi:membrane protein required for beta-lactamase induction